MSDDFDAFLTRWTPNVRPDTQDPDPDPAPPRFRLEGCDMPHAVLIFDDWKAGNARYLGTLVLDPEQRATITALLTHNLTWEQVLHG